MAQTNTESDERQLSVIAEQKMVVDWQSKFELTDFSISAISQKKRVTQN